MSEYPCTIMDKNGSKYEEETIATATETAGLNQETRAKLIEIRERLEPHLNVFNGEEMWYQERSLQFKGIAHITTDDWGVRVRFESENYRTLTLSGRWDVLIAYSNSLGAQYCGWSLSLECRYPELGTSYR